jgi:hypothetical protein
MSARILPAPFMWFPSPKVKIALIAIMGIIGIGLLVWGVPRLYAEVRIRIALQGCGSAGTSSAEIDCIFRVIDSELHRGGVTPAMHVFSLAYEEYPAFANGGCHTRAHRVGDMLYYEIYLGNQSLEKIDFPQDTTACGYGFFHGFMEHLIQDHPDPAFVTQTCSYLTQKLSGRMHDIEATCYHGSGHGFTLAQTERVKKSDWGNVATFVTKPAAECTALPKANAEDIEQCYEGIFNIMDEYMTTDQYGFSYDKEAPFAVCMQQPAFLQQACIYEMAQQLDSISGENAARIVQLVAPITRDTFRQMAFGVGITGIIQQVIDNGNGYSAAYAGCANLQDPYYSSCVKSIVGGLFEEGDPQHEYEKPLIFCADPRIAARNADQTCYERIAEELPRFYDSRTIAGICPQFPASFRSLCTSQITDPSTANTPSAMKMN